MKNLFLITLLISFSFPLFAEPETPSAEPTTAETAQVDEELQSDSRSRDEQDDWKLPPTLTDSHGIEFILVKPGVYLMGSGAESPKEEEKIEYPFYLQKTEMTQALWEKIMGGPTWKNTEEYKNSDPYDESPQHPVYYVSFVDVQGFLTRINSSEKQALYRLPTSEEWEYAARAGSTTEFSYGDLPDGLKEFGWSAENSEQPMAVGSHRPNEWGFYDMHGNVWEWVMGQGEDLSKKIPKNDDDEGRIKRGGSWLKEAIQCKSHSSGSNSIDTRDEDLGFRLVKDISQVLEERLLESE